MGFEFAWDDDSKRAIRYTASGDWNWKDYHLCVRQSLFTLFKHTQPVDSIIDIRSSARAELPRGLAAHASTFGKPFTDILTGRAVAIGFPAEALKSLGVSAAGELITPTGVVRFVADDAEARAVLTAWRQAGDEAVSDDSP